MAEDKKSFISIDGRCQEMFDQSKAEINIARKNLEDFYSAYEKVIGYDSRISSDMQANLKILTRIS